KDNWQLNISNFLWGNVHCSMFNCYSSYVSLMGSARQIPALCKLGIVDFAATVLMLFPAFMIGAAFGILVVMGLAGTAGLQTIRPIIFSVVGSTIGLVGFGLTERWWPPGSGPFILCP